MTINIGFEFVDPKTATTQKTAFDADHDYCAHCGDDVERENGTWVGIDSWNKGDAKCPSSYDGGHHPGHAKQGKAEWVDGSGSSIRPSTASDDYTVAHQTCKNCGQPISLHPSDGKFGGGWVGTDGWGTMCGDGSPSAPYGGRHEPGHVAARTAAKSKTRDDYMELPYTAPMRPQHGVVRAPSTDQRKVRRQIKVKASDILEERLAYRTAVVAEHDEMSFEAGPSDLVRGTNNDSFWDAAGYGHTDEDRGDQLSSDEADYKKMHENISGMPDWLQDHYKKIFPPLGSKSAIAAGYYLVGPNGASVAGPFDTMSIAEAQVGTTRAAAIEYKSGVEDPEWDALKGKSWPYGMNTVNG